MPRSHQEELMRIRAESSAHILAAHASCNELTDHVRRSRAAIGKSLDLLTQTHPTRQGYPL